MLKGEYMFDKLKSIGWERENTDFPFYNDNPKLSNNKWYALIVVSVFLALGSSSFGYDVYISIGILVLPVLVVIYAFKGHFGEIVKVPELNDFWLIILCIIGELILTLSLASIIPGANVTAQDDFAVSLTVMNIIETVIQLIWEELYKFILFITALYVSYKFTSKRGFSVVIATVFALTFFGAMHLSVYSDLFYSVVTIGYGSIVTVYAYLRTKNLLVSYLVHLCYDLILMVLIYLATLLV